MGHMDHVTDLPRPDAALRSAAQVPRLVVACDFDGTLAPFVLDPAEARPIPGAIEELRALAACPNTTVALLSGRHRAGLQAVSGVPDAATEWGIELIGSHGAEWESGAAPLDTTEATLYAQVEARMREIAADLPEAGLEIKPTAVVLHVRRVSDQQLAETALRRAMNLPESLPGAIVTSGKAVVEVAVRRASKGAAIEQLRTREDADAVVFFGDDVTDETGFAVLGIGPADAHDVGVKVGEGETAAGYRIADIPAMLGCLQILRRAREAAARG